MHTIVSHIVLLFLAAFVLALDNGVARRPPLGWSSWNSFKYDVSEELVVKSADRIASLGLKDAGYEYILIDDGWTTCEKFDPMNGKCAVPGPRDSQGRIVADPSKFPRGMKALADYVHSRGLKIGIYTAVSATTCGGFQSSLGHEAVDAQQFADWGMDFVKYDTCNYDCDVKCIIKSAKLMRDGLNATGRPIVYYVDDGNDSSGHRLFNPRHFHVPDYLRVKVADDWQEMSWVWGPETCNMWKSWFDRKDTWQSFLDNVHMQIGLSPYQSCGAFNMPDMVTIGQGLLSSSENRAQMFVYAVLGSPIILGCKLENLDNESVQLVTAPEILAVNQDSDCVQGSLMKSSGSMEAWGKPLSDGSFAVVFLNKGTESEKMSIIMENSAHSHFYPATFLKARVRDLWARKDLGLHAGLFVASVPPHDAVILKFTPL